MIGIFQYRMGALRPADAHTIEMCGRFKAGEVLKAEPKRMRNYKQICLWWALVGVLAEHADWCASKEDASDWLKISIGHFDLIRSPDGKEWARPKSIAYGNCEQTEFDQILNKAIAVICEKIIPGTSNTVLRQELEAMVAPTNSYANGPDDWQTVASDIVAQITQASNRDRLEEITALCEAELTAMKDNSPAQYTRVMRAMELRGQELDHPTPAQDAAPQTVGAG